MHEITDWVRSENVLDMEAHDFNEHDILRFCRARKFDPPKVKLMMTSYAEWYRTEQIDTLYETWSLPSLPRIKALYPHGIHKTARNGLPIWIERPGVADITGIFREFPDSELHVQKIVIECEKFKRLYYPIMTHHSGRNIESVCQIFDLTDGNVRKLASRNCMNLLKLGAKVAQDYYPETMGACYVVNAPMLFKAVYAIIKGFLDERTRSKVQILGSDYQPALLNAIAPENLPAFLGGTCTCSHVEGGCLHSNAGIWNDYVVVNRQVKHINEVEEEKRDSDEEEDGLQFPLASPSVHQHSGRA